MVRLIKCSVLQLLVTILSERLTTVPLTLNPLNLKPRRYGLASSVFSGSTARAVKIGEAIHCGMTNINDFGVNYLVQVLALFLSAFASVVAAIVRVTVMVARGMVVVNPGYGGCIAACVLVFVVTCLLSLSLFFGRVLLEHA